MPVDTSPTGARRHEKDERESELNLLSDDGTICNTDGAHPRCVGLSACSEPCPPLAAHVVSKIQVFVYDPNAHFTLEKLTHRLEGGAKHALLHTASEHERLRSEIASLQAELKLLRQQGACEKHEAAVLESASKIVAQQHQQTPGHGRRNTPRHNTRDTANVAADAAFASPRATPASYNPQCAAAGTTGTGLSVRTPTSLSSPANAPASPRTPSPRTPASPSSTPVHAGNQPRVHGVRARGAHTPPPAPSLHRHHSVCYPKPRSASPTASVPAVAPSAADPAPAQCSQRQPSLRLAATAVRLPCACNGPYCRKCSAAPVPTDGRRAPTQPPTREERGAASDRGAGAAATAMGATRVTRPAVATAAAAQSVTVRGVARAGRQPPRVLPPAAYDRARAAAAAATEGLPGAAYPQSRAPRLADCSTGWQTVRRRGNSRRGHPRHPPSPRTLTQRLAASRGAQAASTASAHTPRSSDVLGARVAVSASTRHTAPSLASYNPATATPATPAPAPSAPATHAVAIAPPSSPPAAPAVGVPLWAPQPWASAWAVPQWTGQQHPAQPTVPVPLRFGSFDFPPPGFGQIPCLFVSSSSTGAVAATTARGQASLHA